MQKLFSVIARVAPNDSSVLISGATGTGKELVARAIHDQSSRSEGRFVDVNCSAIPETLIEAELFGHQRGSFTGALANNCGLFEKASGGTLFLDEIDALNLSAQAKLLRVLQERTVRRIGARTNIAIDVRVISATNCDLAQEVAAGRFRPDLYYRLRVLPLHLPELCMRGKDVELLIDCFLLAKAEHQGVALRRFTPDATRALTNTRGQEMSENLKTLWHMLWPSGQKSSSASLICPLRSPPIARNRVPLISKTFSRLT
jgi:DNA-binding NtrC family response regulator